VYSSVKLCTQVVINSTHTEILGIQYVKNFKK
jgi:hypothetical protein